MNKTGRNDPCICGSKKKYKHCCMQRAIDRERLPRVGQKLNSAITVSGLSFATAGDRVEAPCLPEAAEPACCAAQTGRIQYLEQAAELHSQGKYQQAIELQSRAIELKSDDATAYLNLGVMRVDNGQPDEAIECYSKALLLNPDFKEALYNLGVVMREQGEHLTAIYCSQRVIELDPLYMNAYDNLCDSYIALKNYEALAQTALKSINLDQGHANGYYHLGIACLERNNLEGARSFLERAAWLNPANNNILNTFGLACLACGDLQRGWDGYEKRWFKENMPMMLRRFDWPWWNGEPDRVIFVWREQGIGDQIMFSGMLGDLVARSKKVIFACSNKLMPLMQRSFPAIQVLDLADGASLDGVREMIEVQSALGSLARWLRPDIASFHKADCFLIPDADRVLHWKKRLAGMGEALNVGICWRSGDMSGDRHLYCTRIEQWQAVFSVPGVRFINLQYDECRGELDSALQQCGVTVHAFPELDLFDDLDETAALTKALDLVISVPTTAGILAAALGVPVWMMISGFDWQQLGTAENCWYNSLVSLRRNWDQPWETLLNDVAGRLETQVQSRSNTSAQ